MLKIGYFWQNLLTNYEQMLINRKIILYGFMP
nr:MAG TPA: hypothetical protein [Caudoviricetes sp.]